MLIRVEFHFISANIDDMAQKMYDPLPLSIAYLITLHIFEASRDEMLFQINRMECHNIDEIYLDEEELHYSFVILFFLKIWLWSLAEYILIFI